MVRLAQRLSLKTALLATAVTFALVPGMARADEEGPARTAPPAPLSGGPAASADVLNQIRQELQALRAESAAAKAAEDARARRIDMLADELARATGTPAGPPLASAASSEVIRLPAEPIEAAAEPPARWGGFEPGKGLILMRSDVGEVDLGLVSYLRYLNQEGLDGSYTDSFGNTKTITPREDFQLAKVQITFRGWLFDKRFGYNAYVWTSQTSQGLGAQVVAAGNINWTFSDALKMYFGIHSLPSTRSTNRTFPYWLRNDNRPIADEFFRGSYTQGIWAEGKIARGLEYRAMIANNLSALGVNAGQLDAKPNTYSAALTWMPSTGEFGPANGFGDFEEHQKLATLFSAHYTESTETPQSQPGTESIENTQLRLTDGTLLFSVFPHGRINEARYRMVALNAAAKYKGYSLEGEFYMRWLDSFKIEGTIPFGDQYDTGFQLQAAAMLVPKTLQLYASGSKIFGDFGDPYDIAVGFNYFPVKSRDLRVNMMGLWVKNSPVGYTAYPLPVGGNGFTFVTDFSLAF